MKRVAGGLIELLLAFLILSLVVAYAMQITLIQMKSPINNSPKSVNKPVQAPSSDIKAVDDVIQQVEFAKKIKHQEEQKVIDNWLQ